MYCRKCGKYVSDDSKKCSHCGENLDIVKVEVNQPTGGFADGISNGCGVAVGKFIGVIVIIYFIAYLLQNYSGS